MLFFMFVFDDTFRNQKIYQEIKETAKQKQPNQIMTVIINSFSIFLKVYSIREYPR